MELLEICTDQSVREMDYYYINYPSVKDLKMFLICLFVFHRGQTTRRCHASRIQSSSRYAMLCFFAWASGSSTVCLWRLPVPFEGAPPDPFQKHDLTPQMVNFNKAMSSVRVSVEWLFGDIVEYFKFVDFKKNLKIGLSSTGNMHIVCALLRNALRCLYGNTTSEFFELDPLTLEEYFA